MKKYIYTCFLVIFINSLFFAQQTDVLDRPLILLEGDSIPTYTIPLKEVVVFQTLKFKNQIELNRYILLRRKTLKVYPYAKLASDRLTVLNKRINDLKSKRNKRVYMKRLEKFIYNEFEEELKKLTRSEGEILIRLVHRQTGITTYDLVKELRNGWKAFLYQTTATVFKLSLKNEYDPENFYEDYLIEDILQRAFANQYLEEQEAVSEFDLDSLYYIWKDRKNEE